MSTPIEQELFTAAQFAAFDEQLAAKAARRPATTAERVRAHVAASNEIGDIPRIRHRRVRESCRFNLLRFGELYFGGTSLLRHPPSEKLEAAYIANLESVVLSGGQFVVEIPRGIGKTTWMLIAVVWAILYGHRRYAVLIAASAKMGKKLLKNLLRMIADMPRLSADFPAVAVPLKLLGGISQRAAVQTYHGLSTGIELGSESVKFANLRDAAGNPLDAACGATVAAFGKGAAVKGQNDMGARPDIVLLDDPQTRKDAFSPSATQAIDEYIHGDVLGLAGHDSGQIACLVTITPICHGDLATRLVSKNLHPEWISVVQPLVSQWPENHERLISEYIEAYRLDAARNDAARTESTRFYKEKRAAFAAMCVLDPLAFDAATELDANHHVLNLICKHGLGAFRAEYQLSVENEGGVRQLTAERVALAVNGVGPHALPPGSIGAVTYCDVNAKDGVGLSYVTVALLKQRTVAVVDYGRYPEHEPLVNEGMTPTDKQRAVAAAIAHVVDMFAARRYTRAGGLPPVPVNALCFDRGWMAQVVTRTLAVKRATKPLPFSLLCSVGRGWKQFGSYERTIKRRGDHVNGRESQLGDYIEIHADFWRDMAQGGFNAPPLTPGSLSIYGADPSHHLATRFADEVAAERLVARYIDPVTGREAWQFDPSGENHYGDCLTGALAVASWFGLFEALNLNVDGAAVRGVNAPQHGVAAPYDAAPPPAPAAPRPSVRGKRSFFKSGYW